MSDQVLSWVSWIPFFAVLIAYSVYEQQVRGNDIGIKTTLKGILLGLIIGVWIPVAVNAMFGVFGIILYVLLVLAASLYTIYQLAF